MLDDFGVGAHKKGTPSICLPRRDKKNPSKMQFQLQVDKQYYRGPV